MKETNGAVPKARPARTDSTTPRQPLTGSSLRVYRYVYRQGPVHLSDVQRDLNLSSSSVAEYHLKKLVALGLVHEGSEGYSADRLVFENMVRIRRMVIPLWAAFSTFLATSLSLLVTLLRPSSLTPSYIFSLLTIAVALIVSLYQSVVTLRQTI
jgi:Winged helix DNA-binding domain